MASKMSDRKREEKIQKTLRELQRRKENKRCMDCTEKGPQYVCLNFNTFVCTTCSGILREFSFRVKGISMSVFTEEEVKALKNGGNDKARKVWLAKFNPKDFTEPDSTEKSKIRSFIKKKYVEQKWFRDPRRSADDSDDSSDESSEDEQERRRRERKAKRKQDKKKKNTVSLGLPASDTNLTQAPSTPRDIKEMIPNAPKLVVKQVPSANEPQSTAGAQAPMDLLGLDFSMPAPQAQQANQQFNASQAQQFNAPQVNAPTAGDEDLWGDFSSSTPNQPPQQMAATQQPQLGAASSPFDQPPLTTSFDTPAAASPFHLTSQAPNQPTQPSNNLGFTQPMAPAMTMSATTNPGMQTAPTAAATNNTQTSVLDDPFAELSMGPTEDASSQQDNQAGGAVETPGAAMQQQQSPMMMPQQSPMMMPQQPPMMMPQQSPMMMPQQPPMMQQQQQQMMQQQQPQMMQQQQPQMMQQQQPQMMQQQQPQMMQQQQPQMMQPNMNQNQGNQMMNGMGFQNMPQQQFQMPQVGGGQAQTDNSHPVGNPFEMHKPAAAQQAPPSGGGNPFDMF